MSYGGSGMRDHAHQNRNPSGRARRFDARHAIRPDDGGMRRAGRDVETVAGV